MNLGMTIDTPPKRAYIEAIAPNAPPRRPQFPMPTPTPTFQDIQRGFERELLIEESEEEEEDEDEEDHGNHTPPGTPSLSTQNQIGTPHDSDFVARERLLLRRAKKRIELSKVLARVSEDLMTIKYLRIDIASLESSVWKINLRMGATDPYEYYGIAPNSD